MQKIKTFVNLTLIGISIGWMIGLSQSPIISGVVSTILAFIISILIAVSGLDYSKNENRNLISKVNISLFPIAIFCFFLSISGTMGIYVRTHNYLGINNFQTQDTIKSETNLKIFRNSGGFMGNSISTCEEIQNNLGNLPALKSYLTQLDKPEINNFLKINPDSLSVVIYSKGLCSE